MTHLEGSYVAPLVWLRCEEASAVALFSATALYDVHKMAWIAAVGNTTRTQLIREAGSEPEPEPATRPSVTPFHGRHDRVKARLRMLRRLPTDHDREGAAAPDLKSINSAIAFINRIARAPDFNATLDDDGSAVIEFENRATGFFADVTFRANGRVKFYRRKPGDKSEFLEGELETSEARQFWKSKIGLVI